MRATTAHAGATASATQTWPIALYPWRPDGPERPSRRVYLMTMRMTCHIIIEHLSIDISGRRSTAPESLSVSLSRCLAGVSDCLTVAR